MHKSLILMGSPEALATKDAAEIAAQIAALDEAATAEEVEAKEQQKASVQHGLREVATRTAAETPGGAPWQAEPMVAELDTKWGEMIATREALRRTLEERRAGLERAAVREKTDALVSGVDAKAAAWQAKVAAETALLKDKLATLEATAGSAGDGTALTGDSLAQYEAEAESMHAGGAFALKQAQWAEEKAAIEEEMREANDRLAAEGREHAWEASPADVSGAWDGLGSASEAYLEALVAALGRMHEEEEAALKRKHEEAAALRAIDEALPAMLKRAETVDSADEEAASHANRAENDLLPWVTEQRARLQAELADVKAMNAYMPQASPVGGRKRSTGANTATKLAAEAEALREFIEEDMPPKKGELLGLRGTVHGAMATRQLQRFEGEKAGDENKPRMRFNELLPSPPNAKYRVAVIEFIVPLGFGGSDTGGSDKGANGHRIDSIPIANGVIKAGGACELVRYEASRHADFATSIEKYDGFIVRISPGQLSEGTPAGTQARFDSLMSEQLAKG
jgi:hypothetical protein